MASLLTFAHGIGRRRSISFLVLVGLLLLPIIANAQVTVLSRAILIDGNGGPPQKEFTIVMEGGRIRDLGPSSRITNPRGATAVNLEREIHRAGHH